MSRTCRRAKWKTRSQLIHSLGWMESQVFHLWMASASCSHLMSGSVNSVWQVTKVLKNHQKSPIDRNFEGKEKVSYSSYATFQKLISQTPSLLNQGYVGTNYDAEPQCRNSWRRHRLGKLAEICTCKREEGAIATNGFPWPQTSHPQVSRFSAVQSWPAKPTRYEAGSIIQAFSLAEIALLATRLQYWKANTVTQRHNAHHWQLVYLVCASEPRTVVVSKSQSKAAALSCPLIKKTNKASYVPQDWAELICNCEKDHWPVHRCSTQARNMCTCTAVALDKRKGCVQVGQGTAKSKFIDTGLTTKQREQTSLSWRTADQGTSGHGPGPRPMSFTQKLSIVVASAKRRPETTWASACTRLKFHACLLDPTWQ